MKKQVERLLEDALRTEPEFKLNKDFGHRVLQAVRAKEKRSQRKIYLWMIMGILFICGSGAVLIAFYFPTLLSSFSSENKLNNLVPMAIVVGVLVVLVQYLDKVLIKDRFALR